MKTKDKKPIVPLDAYYVAPKTELADSLYKSEWSLVDRIIYFWFNVGALAFGLFSIINAFVIESTVLTDRVVVIGAWFITVALFWMYHKKTRPNGKPNPRRLIVWLAIALALTSTIQTAILIHDYLWIKSLIDRMVL